MNFKGAEAKVTVAKFIDLAYSEDKGLTARILAGKGLARMSVDQNGQVTLSGSAGMLTFSGRPVLEKIGVKIKRVSVTFSNQGGMKVGYQATYSLEVISLTVSGEFDLEELMTSCSGLLCQAARALKGRNAAYEAQLQQIMGY